MNPVSGATAGNRNAPPNGPGVRDFCRTLAASVAPESFAGVIDSFRKLRVLVVGDIIFDRYSQVSIQGVTSKSAVMSTRLLADELQGGGALAGQRHLQEFCDHVVLVGLVGEEPWVNGMLRSHLGNGADQAVRARGFTSVTKQRYTEPIAPDEQVHPIFAVDALDQGPLDAAVQTELLDRVASQIDNSDLVVTMDFGHGVMFDALRRLVQDKSRCLVVNCQTNSANFGFNILNRQYTRADAFILDEKEIHLAIGTRLQDFTHALGSIRQALQARYAWLTRGPVETIGLHADDPAPCVLAPLEHRVIDPVGAGDAFSSLAALSVARKLPLPLATFIAQIAGALAVRIVGNAEPIRKSALIETGQRLLRG